MSRRLVVAAVAVMVVASAALAFTRAVGVDYGNPDCHLRLPYCDDAQPIIDAVTDGDIGAFFHKQSLLGPVSILVRLPFAAVARLGSYDQKLVYDLGVFPCLLVLGLAGLLVAAEMRRRGRPAWLQAVVGLGVLINPVTFRVLYFGHPEEALAAGLVVAGAVMSMRLHAARTGVAAGLAVTTKLWGVIAVAPLVLALPRAGWIRGVLAAALTVLALYGPLAAADPGRFHGAVTSANNLGTIPGTAAPTNLWWFFMDKASFDRPAAVVGGKLVFKREVGYALPGTLGRLTHPLVILIALALALAWARRERPPGSAEVFLLLALIFLMRCVLDPNNYSYYHLPFLVCLGAWEGIERGFPLFALVSAAYLQFLVSVSPHIHTDAGFEWIYLGWALPTLALVAFLTYRRPSRLDPCPSSA